MTFSPAPEYHVFPSGPEPLDFYEAVVHATRDTLPLVAAAAPDVVVADILTLAPALAAELEGVPCATLIPHVYPGRRARLPGLLARRAAAADGGRPRVLAPGRTPARARACSSGAPELNDTRARARPAAVGARPRRHQPRAGARRHVPPARVPARVAVACARGRPADVGAPGGGRRAPAGREPARARRALDRPGPRRTGCCTPRCAGSPTRPCGCSRPGTAASPLGPLPVPANASVVDWVSYSRTMPHCDVVVCHAGHGTLVRALSSGCAVRGLPGGRRHERERRARVDWAGAGVRVPRRFISPRPLRLAVERALDEPSIRARARELAELGPHSRRRGRGGGAGRAAGRAKKLRGWDSNPQPSVNSRLLCQLSYPGSRMLPRKGSLQHTRPESHAIPSSTSAWQLEHRSTHFAPRSRSFSSAMATPLALIS